MHMNCLSIQTIVYSTIYVLTELSLKERVRFKTYCRIVNVDRNRNFYNLHIKTNN